MDGETTGCFSWIVRFKQSCNERWARFRNRLRRRFYARRGQPIDPTTIVNETGARDMVITNSPHKTNKVLPASLAAKISTETGCPEVVGTEPATGSNEDFEKLVGDYVSCIITNAADSLQTERQASQCKQHVIVENLADNVSLSPSIISHIAARAVTESLSNIILKSNINQSAIHRDIKEFMVQKTLELLAKKFMTVNLQSDYNCLRGGYKIFRRSRFFCLYILLKLILI